MAESDRHNFRPWMDTDTRVMGGFTLIDSSISFRDNKINKVVC